MAEKQKIVVCPYCGNAQHASDRCEVCRGLFEPLSRRATQIAMGPWFIRDGSNPYLPGCSFDMVKRQIESGRIKPHTVMRGPTTRQFWTVARRVPGVAVLLGYCDACGEHVERNARMCRRCGNTLLARHERNELGLQYPTDREAAEAQRSLERQLQQAAAPAGNRSTEPGRPEAGSAARPMESRAASAPAAAGAARSVPGVGANLLDELFEDDALTADRARLAERRHSTLQLDANMEVAAPAHQQDEPAIPAELVEGRSRRAPKPHRTSATMGLLIATNLAMVIAVVVLAVVLMRKDGPPELPTGDVVTPRAGITPMPAPVSPIREDAPPPPLTPETPTPNEVDDEVTFVRPLPPTPPQSEIPAIAQARALADAKKFEEAAAVLEAYQRNTPADQQPADLTDLIAHLREQARLSEIEEAGFFER